MVLRRSYLCKGETLHKSMDSLQVKQLRGALCNIRYPPETYLKLESREVSIPHNLFRSCSMHGSDTVVLRVKLQNDCTTVTEVMDERDFARFEIKMSFGRISYCTGIISQKMAALRI